MIESKASADGASSVATQAFERRTRVSALQGSAASGNARPTRVWAGFGVYSCADGCTRTFYTETRTPLSI